MFYVQSAKYSLKRTAEQRQFSSSSTERQFSSSPEQSQSRSHSSRTVTATVKNQKRSHWFLRYKFVKWIIVAQPRKGPINRNVLNRRQKVFCHVAQATRDNIKGKAIPVQATETFRAARRRGSHNFQKFGSQMAAKLSALSVLVLISAREWVDPRAMVRLEKLRKLKRKVTS
jgi:hypothetical protein